MWFRIVALSIFCFAAPANAEDVKVIGIQIVGKGIYGLETGDAQVMENTPTGEVTSVNRAELMKDTATIPAKFGTEFGFQYIVLGSPDGADVSLDFVITYPKQGLTNPDTGETINESRYSEVKKMGQSEYMGYSFESDWEAEPGDWIFEIWHDGTMLTRQEFAIPQ